MSDRVRNPRPTPVQMVVLVDGLRDHKLIRRAHPRTLDALERANLIYRVPLDHRAGRAQRYGYKLTAAGEYWARQRSECTVDE